MYYIHNHTRSGTLSLEEGTSCKSCRRQIQGTYLLGTGEVSRMQYLLMVSYCSYPNKLYTCGDSSASRLSVVLLVLLLLLVSTLIPRSATASAPVSLLVFGLRAVIT